MMEHCVEPYFSLTEAAELLGCRREKLQSWVEHGKLKVRVIEGKNFIRLVDMEQIVYEGMPNKDIYMQVKQMEAGKFKRYTAKRDAKRRLQRQLSARHNFDKLVKPRSTNKKD